MLEPKAGVFIGTLSAMVRDHLWAKACQGADGGACILIHNAANEQGFAVQYWGETGRILEDFEGLYLVRIPD